LYAVRFLYKSCNSSQFRLFRQLFLDLDGEQRIYIVAVSTWIKPAGVIKHNSLVVASKKHSFFKYRVLPNILNQLIQSHLFRCFYSHSISPYALTSSTSSRVKPRCLSALYSDGKNGSGASLNSVRFRYFFLPISRSVVSSAVRLLDCGGVLSAFSLPQPRLTR